MVSEAELPTNIQKSKEKARADTLEILLWGRRGLFLPYIKRKLVIPRKSRSDSGVMQRGIY